MQMASSPSRRYGSIDQWIHVSEETIYLQGYREDAQLVLESDADEQLIMHINFMSSVKVHSLVMQGPAGGHAPKQVKLFCNRATLGFSEAEEEAASQVLDLSEAEATSGDAIPLRCGPVLREHWKHEQCQFYLAEYRVSVNPLRVSQVFTFASSGGGISIK